MKLSEREYRILFLHYEPFTPERTIQWKWIEFNTSGQLVSLWSERDLNCMAAMLSVYKGVKEG